MRIISLNLRYAHNAEMNTQGIREPRIVDFVKNMKPNSLGVQECEKFWRDRLCETIGALGYVPVQDEVYSEEGKYAFKNFIYYNTETTELIDSGRMWLSETPSVPSRGFGQGFFISAGWALLRVKDTGFEYMHINTHITASTGEEDKEQYKRPQTKVLAEKIKEFKEKGYTVFVTGDFNSKETTDVYKIMTAELLDARHTAEETSTLGSFNGHKLDSDCIDPKKYHFPDYVFYSQCDGMKIDKFNVIDKWNGNYMSDHNALVVDVSER